MPSPLQPDWLFPLLAAPFVGSFLGLLVVRLPQGGAVVLSRSTCPACGHVLGPADLVPILSWLVRRGRCRHCQAPVSALYPGIELAALGVAAWAAVILSGWPMWAGCALGWTLLALAAIDWRHGMLPDSLTLPLAAGGLAVAYGIDAALLPDHLIGAAAGFVGFAAIAWLYRRVRGREGLGLGDAKLLTASGAWLSWEGLPSVVLIAAVSALLVALASACLGHPLKAHSRLPFGPYLALGTWLVWLYGPIVIGG